MRPLTSAARSSVKASGNAAETASMPSPNSATVLPQSSGSGRLRRYHSVMCSISRRKATIISICTAAGTVLSSASICAQASRRPRVSRATT